MIADTAEPEFVRYLPRVDFFSRASDATYVGDLSRRMRRESFARLHPAFVTAKVVDEDFISYFDGLLLYKELNVFSRFFGITCDKYNWSKFS